MHHLKTLLLITALLPATTASAQRYKRAKNRAVPEREWYAYWGYHRSVYSKSTIRFVGADYNFRLMRVAAEDRPSGEFFDYVNPARISATAFNFRIGRYLTSRWDISVGCDHMIYAMRQGQSLGIAGYIAGTTNSDLNGTYSNGDSLVAIRPDDLHYDHASGLNYVAVQLNTTLSLYEGDKVAIRQRMGVGLGPVITKSRFKWDGNVYASRLRWGGYGVSLHAAIRFDFFNRFFLQSKLTGGGVHLPKSATTQERGQHASHHFAYGSWELVAGVLWHFGARANCDCPRW